MATAIVPYRSVENKDSTILHHGLQKQQEKGAKGIPKGSTAVMLDTWDICASSWMSSKVTFNSQIGGIQRKQYTNFARNDVVTYPTFL